VVPVHSRRSMSIDSADSTDIAIFERRARVAQIELQADKEQLALSEARVQSSRCSRLSEVSDRRNDLDWSDFVVLGVQVCLRELSMVLRCRASLRMMTWTRVCV
jgi:hypothetical protein